MGACISQKQGKDSARTSGVLTPTKKIKIRRSNFRKIYTVIDKIHERSRTTVLLVSDKLTGEKRSIKSTKLSNKNYDSALYELEVLQQLDHPNIIKVFECFLETNFLHIVTEYCSGGEIFEKITSKTQFNEHLAAIYMRQIISALIYLNKNSVIYRHLNPSNILFVGQEDSLLKLVNFSEINNSTSFLFTSPEGLSNSFAQNSNIWNLGVIFYLMLSGTLPFSQKNTAEEHFVNIQNLEVKFESRTWKSVSAEAKALILKMLVKDPRKRITASEVFESDWMKRFLFDQSAPRLSRKSLTKLSRYSEKSKLKRAMLSYMVGKVNLTESTERIMKIFRDTDLAGQGELKASQIISSILGSSFKVEDPFRLVSSMNINKKGLITYTEFLASLIDWNSELSEDKLVKLFEEFDLNGDGVITNKEFLEVLQTDCSLNEIQEMIKEVDQNGDGLVDYKDFSNFFRNNI